MPPYTSPSESDCLQSRTAACFKIVLSGQPRPPSATACALLDAIGRVKSKFRLPSSKFDQALGYYVPSILGNGRTFRFVGTYVAHHKNTLPLRGEGSYNVCAGWSSQVARWAHNPKVAGSNPAPATKSSSHFLPMSRVSGKPYFVYVLWSESRRRFYIGTTEDPQKRLQQHNHSERGWSARYAPWRLIYHQRYSD